MNLTENRCLVEDEIWEHPEHTSENETESAEKNRVEGGTLYLVATPIGNLSDLSDRAKKVLREVDLIATEDTRNSLKLLSLCQITGKSLISYFEHNKRERAEVIVRRLKEGQSCALITDAGTPAISDPGEDLVRRCAQEKIPVTAVPGCCAAITALTLSGLNTRRFVFEGFLEGSKSERRARLSELADEKRTLILYEAPHRLKDTLSDLSEIFGNRQIALCRELTKRNEEILRTTIDGAVDFYTENIPRGEYVLILQGAEVTRLEHSLLEMTIEEHMNYYLGCGLDRKVAMKQVAKDRGVGKSVIYKQLMMGGSLDVGEEE